MSMNRCVINRPLLMTGEILRLFYDKFHQGVRTVQIEKNETTYSVSECINKWVVKTKKGKVSVSYEVSKELCATEDDLWDYVMTNDIFR